MVPSKSSCAVSLSVSGPLVLVTVQAASPSARLVKVSGPGCHWQQRPCASSAISAIGWARSSRGDGPIEVISGVKKLRIDSGRPFGARRRSRPSTPSVRAGDGDGRVGRDEAVILVERRVEPAEAGEAPGLVVSVRRRWCQAEHREADGQTDVTRVRGER